MARIRFVMIGGFLGAGKTTTIARLARKYQDSGLKVGIVTNDQATDLVDTHSLRSLGYEVGEVAGSCFCCDFEGLTSTLGQLGAGQRPDVILAEPVGSCTDLVATVIQPLLRMYDEKFDVAPYGVILKPSHGRRILKGEKKAGFSPKAEYIFRKQLQEADFLIINRIDELTLEEVLELAELVGKEQPGIPTLRISAKTGEGFEALAEMFDQRGDFGRRILDLDYDIYAAGEAELGWLNSSMLVTASEEFILDEFLLNIVSQLRQSLAQAGAETAHLKTIGLWEGFYGVANLVSSDSQPSLSLPSNCRLRQANVIVNARVAIDPDQLAEHVQKAIHAACSAAGAKADHHQIQSFRPGRPDPTHRYATAE